MAVVNCWSAGTIASRRMSPSGGSRRRTWLRTSVSKQYSSVELRRLAVARAFPRPVDLRNRGWQLVPVLQRSRHRQEASQACAPRLGLGGADQRKHWAAAPGDDESLAPSHPLDELGKAGLG